MKTIQQIQDEYAKEQGFENWKNLYFCFHVDGTKNDEDFFLHEKVVIQIVQNELKKKMTDEIDFIVSVDANSILNTENIK